MKKIVLVSLLLLFSVGCRRMYNEFCTFNRLNLSTLSVGMDEREVRKIMEHKPVLRYKNPHEIEEIELSEKEYKVLHYITSRKAEFTTPVFFYEGKLEGWGRGFIKEYSEKSKVGVD